MKLVPTLLGVALLVVGATAIHLSRQLESGRQQIAARELQLQPQSGTDRPQPAVPTEASGVPVIEFSEEEVAAARKAAPAVPAATPEYMEAIREQARSPESLARMRAMQRDAMVTRHPDVGEAVGLSQQELEELYPILVDRQGLISITTARSESGAASDPQETMARLREARARGDAQLQALLGDRYARWQDYEKTRPVWEQRRDLRDVLNAAGTPMTETQERSLIEALSTEQRALNQLPSTPFNQHTPERHERLLAAAASSLSAQQVESYRQMLVRAAAQEQDRARMFGPGVQAATP